LLRICPRKGFAFGRAFGPAGKLATEGEKVAAAFLQKQGHKILKRRAKLAGVEVDLVTRFGAKLVLVEVKTRLADQLALAAGKVNRLKLARLRRAARVLAKRLHVAEAAVRLDLVVVCIPSEGDPQVRHYPGIA
jgi:putative endonuclease